MPTKAIQQTTQTQLIKAALEELAIIGGALIADDDISFEGSRFVFPERFQGDLPGLNQFVNRYVAGQEEEVVVDRTYQYRPHDGAHAVYQCLKRFFGYAQGKARQTLFGKQPPQEIVIPVGYSGGRLQQVAVPWGDMIVPGLKGATMTVTENYDQNKGMLLRLYTRCRKADKAVIEGFYQVVGDYLREFSIYRGKCINGGMEFIDTDAIDPDQFIYTERVWRQAMTHIISPMVHTEEIKRNNLNPKRVNLLAGIYGVGKTGLGRTAAKRAVENGWTAMVCRPGQDDPFEAMQTLALYVQGTDGKGGLLFCEDVDVLASTRDPHIVTQLLDRFDGFTSKGENMVFVMTTNHAERIHKGMVRPGRLDSIIKIGDMDRAGVEKLCRLVIGANIAPDTDFDAVHAATSGFTPAYVREAIERAVRFGIARTGRAGTISTDDLVGACESLRDQYELQEAASDTHEHLPTLDAVFREMLGESESVRDIVDNIVENKVNGAVLYNPQGKHLGTITTNG